MGIGLYLAMFSSICVKDYRGRLLSVEKYFSQSNESQLENYKDEVITCKDIEITEEKDKYIINYKSNDGINKEILAVKEYVKLYECKDGNKKIEVYNLPDEIEIRNRMFSFSLLGYEDYKIYKIYK